MLKSIIEDLIFIAILGALAWWAYKKYAGNLLATINAGAREYAADVETVLSPVEAAQALFQTATAPDYISPAQYDTNIAEIRARLIAAGTYKGI